MTVEDTRVSVILPTLNAADSIGTLLSRLQTQTLPPEEILVVDSASDDGTAGICRAVEGVRVMEIARADFDHGGTRDMAFRACSGDVVLFLTQDAAVMGDDYVETLTRACLTEGVACACGRQIARDDAPRYEKLTREFNYPETSFLRDASDVTKLGIKAFFLSDACSAYRREAYLAVGGFDRPVRTNEDMLIAAKFLSAGYRIAYAAEAAVRHSHSYTFRQEYRRNFNIGWILEQYRARFQNIRAEGEGVRYVRFVLRGLWKQRALFEIVRFSSLCAAKVLGSGRGRAAARRHAAGRQRGTVQ